VASAPDGLTLAAHRDLRGRGWHVLVRRILVALVGLFLLLALANAFGQHPTTDVAENESARLEVYSPHRLRSGLYFESRFRIDARREIENATLVLEPGWLEGMTLNTLEPAPIGEASRDGRIALELGRIPAGQQHLFFMQFQANPTNVGRRSQRVELHDGETRLLAIDREVTIFP
jgi:hypothetical protein